MIKKPQLVQNFLKQAKSWLIIVWKITVFIIYTLIQYTKRIPKLAKKIPGYTLLAKKTFQKFMQDDCIGYSSQLAFNLVLALFPVILLLVTSLSFIQSPSTIQILSAVIGDVFPSEVQVPISEAISSAAETTERIKRGDILALSLIFSFFSATSIFLTIMKGMRNIYKIKTKISSFQKYKTAFELVIIVGLAMLIVVNILLASHKIKIFLYDLLGWKLIPWLFDLFKYPITILIIIITTTIVYKLTLRIGQRLEHVVPGAICVAILWIPVSIWFSDYMTGPLYGVVYKTLAKLIAMPIWMYANSIIFFIGAELNSILYKPPQPKRKQKISVRIKRFLNSVQS